METTNRMKQSMAAAIVVAFVAVAMISCFDTASAEGQSYDQDMGDFYGYKLQFVFNGSDAATIEWNFGDGSAVSTDWNPAHTYAATGVYYVTQTVTNTYDPDGDGVGTTATEVYKINVCGYPIVSFDSNGGSDVANYTARYNKTLTQAVETTGVSMPAEPTKSGYTFAGWYADEDLTTAWTDDSLVMQHITLYAKWTASSTPSPDGTPAEPEHTIDDKTVGYIALAAGIIVIMAGLAVVRRPIAFIAGIALIALWGLITTGMITW